jgi:hypothetical protein
MSKEAFDRISAGLQVLEDVLAAYPNLTREKALEMLREAGHFAPKAKYTPPLFWGDFRDLLLGSHKRANPAAPQANNPRPAQATRDTRRRWINEGREMGYRYGVLGQPLALGYEVGRL